MSNNAKQNLAQNSFTPTAVSSFPPLDQGSYASTKNKQYAINSSNFVSVDDRWNYMLTQSPGSVSSTINTQLPVIIREFFLRNPKIKSWNDLLLAQAVNAKMSKVKIDTTMQRQLDMHWVLHLLANFKQTKVVPIQVYRPTPGVDEFLAWDGQHTLVLLWLIATKAFGLNPDTVEIPVNIYHTHLKSEIRECYIALNSQVGKRALDQFDIWEQKIFGVRIDGSKDPNWLEVENKQNEIEMNGLFITSPKCGDETQPGAISRLQEINKFSIKVVSDLSKYLNLSTNSTGKQRSTVEKEIVMMSHFFNLCEVQQIPVDDRYVIDLFNTMNLLFNADFSPQGPFWSRVSLAYNNWFNAFNLTGNPRCSKEVNHGMPFLIAQLKKSLYHPVPLGNSSSSFSPLLGDLF